MRGLAGKVAIVTGGARGIGKAVVARLLEEEMSVMIADIDEAEGQATVKALGHRDRVRFTECDVSERLDLRNLIADTLNAFGAINVLVNNAGIVGGGDFLELTEEDYDRVMAVNLKGAFMASQMVARHMVEQVESGGAPGTIISMSSINAVFALPTQVPYSLSKAGLTQLTKVAALSLAPYGIRVNAVGPGSIDTAMLASVNANAEAKRTVLSRTPLGRIGEPSEVAGLVAYLASDDASYITGQTVYVDGGRLPLNYTVPVA